MGLLFNLADQYETDKRLQDHAYVIFYEQLMEQKRFTTSKLLEVGFGKGGSVRTWMDYFPNADIYCMEYFDKEYQEVWHNPSIDIPELKMVTGDSTKESTWDELPYDFDFIIDDGSHFPEDQIATFLNGFKHLKSRGLYFIEDTHCQFHPIYNAKDVIYPWVFDLVMKQQTPWLNYGGNFYACRNAIQDIAKDIYSYQFFKSVIVFEKA